MPENKDENLAYLLAAAKKIVMSESDREQQRRSFAYGNTKIENDHITKETIERAAEALKHER